MTLPGSSLPACRSLLFNSINTQLVPTLLRALRILPDNFQTMAKTRLALLGSEHKPHVCHGGRTNVLAHSMLNASLYALSNGRQ
jgi:hypothetical protein